MHYQKSSEPYTLYMLTQAATKTVALTPLLYRIRIPSLYCITQKKYSHEKAFVYC
jgi:hypothetical protein